MNTDIIQDDHDQDDDDEIQVVRKFDTVKQRQQALPRLQKPIKKDVMFSPEYLKAKMIRDSFKRQKFDQLLQLALEEKKLVSEFDELTYHDEVFRVNQNILINNASNANDDYVARLMKIYQIKEVKSQQLILLAEVKWYYKKNEIIKYHPQYKHWISNSEVFSTDQTDIIQATAINGSCTILSLKEYETHDGFERVYFTRLGWLPKKNKFEGFEKIETQCKCRQPINPDLEYIQCDNCNEWYHFSCVGIKKGQYEDQDYICDRCHQ